MSLIKVSVVKKNDFPNSTKEAITIEEISKAINSSTKVKPWLKFKRGLFDIQK